VTCRFFDLGPDLWSIHSQRVNVHFTVLREEMKSNGRRGATYSILGAEILAVAYLIYSILHLHWPDAVMSICTAIAIPCWVIAVKVPTRCGVTTKHGHPCPNPTTGVLVGCGSAAGHAWAKVLARFGWKRQALPSSKTPRVAASPQLSSDTGKPEAAAEPMVVRIAEDRRSAVAFWMAVTSTVAGATSAIAAFTGPVNTW
jgi:hypothetical protein